MRSPSGSNAYTLTALPCEMIMSNLTPCSLKRRYCQGWRRMKATAFHPRPANGIARRILHPARQRLFRSTNSYAAFWSRCPGEVPSPCMIRSAAPFSVSLKKWGVHAKRDRRAGVSESVLYLGYRRNLCDHRGGATVTKTMKRELAESCAIQSRPEVHPQQFLTL
jgi:hypothetical protein